MKNKTKKVNYVIPYIISVALVILIDIIYFSSLKLNPTFHIFFSILLFTIILGVLIKIIESLSKK